MTSNQQRPGENTEQEGALNHYGSEPRMEPLGGSIDKGRRLTRSGLGSRYT